MIRIICHCQLSDQSLLRLRDTQCLTAGPLSSARRNFLMLSPSSSFLFLKCNSSGHLSLVSPNVMNILHSSYDSTQSFVFVLIHLKKNFKKREKNLVHL